MNVRKRIVLPETREVLQTQFPVAFENLDYLRLLEYLLFSTFRDKDDPDLLVVDAGTLARIQGKEKSHRGRNYKASTLLEDFSRDVFPLEWTEYRFKDGKARAVRRPTSVVLGIAVGKALQREFTSARAERQARGVYLETGEQPPQRLSGTAKVEAEKAKAAQLKLLEQRVPEDHPAKKWMIFLNSQPDRALKDIVHRNLEVARNMVLASTSMTATTKAFNLRVLHDIEEDPKPLYQPSPEEKTVRLFPAGSTYLSLSRDIRKALTSGSYEFDLSAAQLTLAAHVWGVPTVQNMVVTDYALGPWGMLGKRAGLPVKPSMASFPQKAAIKRGTYALLFGGGKTTVLKELLGSDSDVEGLTQKKAEQLLNSDVFRELLEAQERRQSKFLSDGGFTDIFGRWIPLVVDGRQRDVKSLLAQELQAYELSVMLPGLEYLMELGTKKVTVLAWQHDGITLHFKDASKEERYIRQFNERIHNHATKVLGIPWWSVRMEGVRL